MDKNHADFNRFIKLFNFRQEMAGFIGIERERFLRYKNGFFAPNAQEFLSTIRDERWTYELSACQAEDRTCPNKEIIEINKTMARNDETGKRVAKEIGLELHFVEVAEENMPLDIYPDPRYLKISRQISQERLIAACRVTGTHIHIGMPNIDSSVKIANLLQANLQYFCNLGDHSHGERLRLYKQMAPNWHPPCYKDAEHFFEVARQEGFAENPRNCWHLIRISKHGTVELRMFGVTEKNDEVCFWIETAQKIIQGK